MGIGEFVQAVNQGRQAGAAHDFEKPLVLIISGAYLSVFHQTPRENYTGSRGAFKTYSTTKRKIVSGGWLSLWRFLEVGRYLSLSSIS